MDQHQIKMTGYLKDPHTVIFTSPTGCGKSHLVLDVIEKKYSNHFHSIIIICPTLQWSKTYHAKCWIRHDNNVCLIEPKNKL